MSASLINSFATSWLSPAETLTVSSDEVHLWRVNLDRMTARMRSLSRTLSADERARAKRFHFQMDRCRFVVARGLLRSILGRYLNGHPSQLSFSYNAFGKPFLTNEWEQGKLSFNLSYSHGLALYVIARNREIGVDVEQICPTLANQRIAEQFFSEREVATLYTLPRSMKAKAFFKCWTSKEAYIKARGEGLSIPLNKFDVTLTPGEPAALLETRESKQEASRWSLREVEVGSGYAAALAIEGHDWQLKCWQYPQ